MLNVRVPLPARRFNGNRARKDNSTTGGIGLRTDPSGWHLILAVDHLGPNYDFSIAVRFSATPLPPLQSCESCGDEKEDAPYAAETYARFYSLKVDVAAPLGTASTSVANIAGRDCRQLGAKNRAIWTACRDLKLPAVKFNDGMTYRQSHPHAVRLGREKWLENARLRGPVDAGPGVADAQHHVRARFDAQVLGGVGLIELHIA